MGVIVIIDEIVGEEPCTIQVGHMGSSIQLLAQYSDNGHVNAIVDTVGTFPFTGMVAIMVDDAALDTTYPDFNRDGIELALGEGRAISIRLTGSHFTIGNGHGNVVGHLGRVVELTVVHRNPHLGSILREGERLTVHDIGVAVVGSGGHCCTIGISPVAVFTNLVMQVVTQDGLISLGEHLDAAGIGGILKVHINVTEHVALCEYVSVTIGPDIALVNRHHHLITEQRAVDNDTISGYSHSVGRITYGHGERTVVGTFIGRSVGHRQAKASANCNNVTTSHSKFSRKVSRVNHWREWQSSSIGNGDSLLLAPANRHICECQR